MKYFVYLIVSKKNYKLTSYVGYTNNLKKRLSLHNSSKGAKFTRGRFWKIIYKKSFDTKKEALIYEYMLKKDRFKRNKIKIKYLNNEKI
jgi:putative endonuclease